MIIWVIAGLLGLATGLRIGWALVNKQSLVSTAMILALGSLGLVAALNWQPLTLLLDTLLHWPNISMGLTQVALVALRGRQLRDDHDGRRRRVSPRPSAGSRCAQYGVAVVIAVASLVAFFAAGRQPEMSPEEYLRRNLGSDGYVAAVAAAAAVRAAGADAGVVGRACGIRTAPGAAGRCSCSPSASC